MADGRVSGADARRREVGAPNWNERALDETTLSFSTAGLEPGSWSLQFDAKLKVAPERCDGFAECELQLERGEVVTFVVTP